MNADNKTKIFTSIAVNSHSAYYVTNDGKVYTQQLLTPTRPASVRVCVCDTADWLIMQVG
jgi:hypothetical protein